MRRPALHGGLARRVRGFRLGFFVALLLRPRGLLFLAAPVLRLELLHLRLLQLLQKKLLRFRRYLRRRRRRRVALLLAPDVRLETEKLAHSDIKPKLSPLLNPFAFTEAKNVPRTVAGLTTAASRSARARLTSVLSTLLLWLFLTRNVFRLWALDRCSLGLETLPLTSPKLSSWGLPGLRGVMEVSPKTIPEIASACRTSRGGSLTEAARKLIGFSGNHAHGAER